MVFDENLDVQKCIQYFPKCAHLSPVANPNIVSFMFLFLDTDISRAHENFNLIRNFSAFLEIPKKREIGCCSLDTGSK